MMSHRRSAFAWIAGALLVIAGCGSDDSPNSVPAAPASSSPAADATRSITHAMGVTDVSASPERVVVLDSSFLDAALALGFVPVGATEASAGFGIPTYLADRVTDIEIVGMTDEPNLEAVAMLQPDLILGAKVRHEALYTQLSEIAPTVFSESSGTNWKDGLMVAADALGALTEAEQWLAGYEARTDALGTEVSAEGTHLSMVRFLLPDQIRLYGPDTFSGSVLSDIGFDLGDHAWDEYSMAYLSAEEIGLADADVVFATSYGGSDSPADAATFEAVRPLWEALPAVAEGRQHWVEDDIWMLGIGPLGAQLILDDVETLLAG